MGTDEEMAAGGLAATVCTTTEAMEGVGGMPLYPGRP